MSEVLVSIYVPTFNHEKYITRALDSILMQKTHYPCEVFVGEDCSTDNTRQVLQAWEQLHPGKFTIFYREKNMYNSSCSNAMDLLLRCKGKYVICLEGDDFWTDPEKIEKQVSFLENHPEYYAVAHNCTVVGEDSLPNGEQYQECKDEEYTLAHFASEIMPGQFTTVLRRNYFMDEGFDKSLLQQRLGPGDRNIYFSILCQGRIHCIQENMSAYRHITSGGSSYSATFIYKYENEIGALWNRIQFAERIANKDALYYARFMYLMQIRNALRKRRISAKKALEDAQKVPKWYKFLPVMLKRDLNRFIFHKCPYI